MTVRSMENRSCAEKKGIRSPQVCQRGRRLYPIFDVKVPLLRPERLYRQRWFIHRYARALRSLARPRPRRCAARNG